MELNQELINLLKGYNKYSKFIINKRISQLHRDTFEERVSWWNRIKENYDNFNNIIQKIDIDKNIIRNYQANFEYSLLLLANSYKINDEDFAEDQYIEKEFEICNKIEEYSYFEITGEKEIRNDILSNEKYLDDMFEQYPIMVEWVKNIVLDPEIKEPIKYYLKKKWDEYREKIDTGWKLWIDLKQMKNPRAILQNKNSKINDVQLKDDVINNEIDFSEIEDGPRLINGGEACLYEQNFLGRLKSKIKNNIILLDEKYKVNNLEIYHKNHNLEFINNENNGNIPDNSILECNLITKKFFKKKKILFKGIFICRINRYKKFGYDTYPLEIDEIMPYIKDNQHDNDDKKSIILIGSPTGFSEKTIKSITEKFLSTFSLCLVDLETNNTFYNDNDISTMGFKDLFTLETKYEQLKNVKKDVMQLIVEKGTVRLDNLVKKYGHNEQIIKRVFNELSNSKDYQSKFYRKYNTLVLVKKK